MVVTKNKTNDSPILKQAKYRVTYLYMSCRFVRKPLVTQRKIPPRGNVGDVLFSNFEARIISSKIGTSYGMLVIYRYLLSTTALLVVKKYGSINELIIV